jgi:hypothetical protein
MKKKRLVQLGLALLTALLFVGCGTDKNLEPSSELVLQGADPPSLNVSVSPPLTRLTYFVFRIRLNEKGLSLVPSDAWTIDSYDISYSLQSDPGGHLVALPASQRMTPRSKVTPGIDLRLPVTIITDSYLRDNAQGFVGTTDSAIVKAQLVFHSHRNKDGVKQSNTARFLFTIGNF